MFRLKILSKRTGNLVSVQDKKNSANYKNLSNFYTTIKNSHKMTRLNMTFSCTKPKIFLKYPVEQGLHEVTLTPKLIENVFFWFVVTPESGPKPSPEHHTS